MPHTPFAFALAPLAAVVLLAAPAPAQSDVGGPRPATLRLAPSSGGQLEVGMGPRDESAIDLALVRPERWGPGARGAVFRMPGDSARAWTGALDAFFASDASAPPVLRLADVDRRTAGVALVVERQALAGVPDSLAAFVLAIETGRGRKEDPVTLWRYETREQLVQQPYYFGVRM